MGEGRHDDLVTLADTGDKQSDVKRGESRTDGDDLAVDKAEGVGDSLFECIDVASHPKPATAERLGARCHFLAFDERSVNSDVLIHGVSRFPARWGL